jgi:hypothetical protein
MEEEARRLIDGAREQGVQLRIIGGLAYKMQSPSAEHRALARAYGDIDLVGYKKQRAKIVRVLEDLSYVPNRSFNALQGHRRLLFVHPDETYDVDVFLDVFPMCHTLDFVGRLEEDEYTIPLPELLLSKLQVVQLNEKDLKDIYALLEDHAVAESSAPDVIDLRVITRLCGTDWGWYKTVTLNIDKALALADEYLAGDEGKDLITGRLQGLRDAIEAVPKSLKWRARARIGERVRWYELPDDMEGEIGTAGAHRGTGAVGPGDKST